MSLFYQGKRLAPSNKKHNKFRKALIGVSCLAVVLGSTLAFSSYKADDDMVAAMNVSSYSSSREDEVFAREGRSEKMDTVEQVARGVSNAGRAKMDLLKEEFDEPIPVKDQEIADPPISVDDYIERFYTISSGLSTDELEVFLIGIENEGDFLFGNNETFKTFIEEEKKNIENVKKLEFVLDDYGITKEQFMEVGATVLAEAAPNYEDQYNVTSTMLNRLCNSRWTNYISNVLGGDKGNNLYYQVVCDGQFTAYESDNYYDMLNLDLDEYQAVLDCLTSGKPSHNYLSFKAYEVENSERLAPNGNYYHEDFNEIERKDRTHYMVDGSSDELKGMMQENEKTSEVTQYIKK